MAGIVHAFTSGKADGADATLARASNWNADHSITGDVNFNGYLPLAPTGRGGYLVAANDALARAKSQSDSLCDAANDEVQLAAGSAAVGKGLVLLSDGTFAIGASCTLDDGATIKGQGAGERAGATTLAISGTNYGVIVQDANVADNVMSRLHGVRITTPASFAAIGLKVYVLGYLQNRFDILNDVQVIANNSGYGQGTDQTAGSVGLRIQAEQCFAGCTFRGVGVNGYEIGTHIYIYGSGGQWPYFNGNTFYDHNTWFSKYGTKLENVTAGGSGSEIANNTWIGGNYEPALNSSSVNAIRAIAAGGSNHSINRNWWHMYTIWDWSGNGQGPWAYWDSQTGANRFEGMCPENCSGGQEWSDLGGDNQVVRLNAWA